MTLPASWAVLLEMFRPGFRRRGTFTLFTVLATGMVAQTGRRSVVGMLSGARMAGVISFHAACRFFSQAVWDVDQLGLIAARLVVRRLLDDDAPVTVVVDDTLFKRWGRKVHHAFWTHDGAAQGGRKIARGNRWVVAGIVVRLPFCAAPVCLPVLFRLWAGKAPPARSSWPDSCWG
ncbi:MULTISPECIES: transposase [unclassified Frankia]|uniref:transposase n=1 Tax=unclassified Frankia TaxID=2632575 RepID=UPI001EF56F4D|nr:MULTISPECIES: transposase [unclassified Frankia]